MNYFFINNIKISEKQHSIYKKQIVSALNDIYPGKVFIDDMWYVAAQDFDSENSEISIINRAIGNITLIKHLINTFGLKTFKDLITFVKNNKISLFKATGNYFESVLEILKKSERKGIKNEKKAIKFIKRYLKSKDIKFSLKQTPLYSRLDVIDGIDIILTIENKEWYVQVKPLKEYSIRNNWYKINSSGKIKEYDIHYYIFVIW